MVDDWSWLSSTVTEKSFRRVNLLAQIEDLFSRVDARMMSTLQTMPVPEGVVYACGFWLFYCDYTTLGVPAFAYNTVGNEGEWKWSPPNWVVDVEDLMVDALQPLYTEISSFMAGKSDDDWRTLVKYQWDFYSKFCLDMNSDIEKQKGPLTWWNLTEDFVVGIFEEREGDEMYDFLVKASVGEERAQKLGIVGGLG